MEELLAFGRDFLASAMATDDECDMGVDSSTRSASAIQARPVQDAQQRRNVRRGLCSQERDQVCEQEAVHVRLRERLGRQNFLTQRAQQQFVTDKKRSEAQMLHRRRTIKKAKEQRQQLWSSAFGEASLFRSARFLAAGQALEVPCSASTLEVPGCDGLADVSDVVMVLRGLSRKSGSACSVGVVSQLLLRLPTFAKWLCWHEGRCDAQSACVACILFRTRLQFGSGELPGLWVHRAAVGEKYEECRGIAPIEFLVSVLDTLRLVELRGGRCVAWPGVGVQEQDFATHVDRAFCFLEECRMQCTECGTAMVRYQRQFVLRLPPPNEQSSSCSVFDGYLQSCGPVDGGMASHCGRCAASRPHLVQTRLATLPEFLVVHVDRRRSEDAMSRFPLQVDEQVTLPGLSGMVLVGMVFHFGRAPAAGHYTCACRGPTGSFWYFDDARKPVYVPQVAGFFEKNVETLVYSCQGVGSLGKGLLPQGVPSQGRSDPDLEAVRRTVEALRLPSERESAHPSPLSPGRRVALEKATIMSSRLWGDRTFRKIFFEDPGRVGEVFQGASGSQEGVQSEFDCFAELCREHGFESHELERQPGPPVQENVSASRRQQVRRVVPRAVCASAAQRRLGAEGMQRLFVPKSTPQSHAGAVLSGTVTSARLPESRAFEGQLASKLKMASRSVSLPVGGGARSGRDRAVSNAAKVSNLESAEGSAGLQASSHVSIMPPRIARLSPQRSGSRSRFW